ncbi:hypothetical protein GH714_038716 [Hevea brasiliensis]|uniref:AAA+ ATPase domain-containing protein n=1 Tax=Hevea brasiliensis TaxID=3981 RepID=A0A6A6L7Y7_HEVBR|nr:hypothetical protein GH714_038716 [Hevea brasiliensis]
MSFMELVGLTPIICSSCKSIATRVSNVVNVNQMVRSLTTALKELKDKSDDLKRRVGRADLEGLTCTNQVQGWLERVEVVESKASLIIESLGQRNECYGCCSANFCSKYKLSKKVSKLQREINELIGKGAFDTVVADRLSPEAVQEVPNRPAVGPCMMLERVMQFLSEDEVGTIGIYGMGGVGKTTLLKSINNEFLTTSHCYDVVIWVVVSKDFAADKIQQAVGTRLGLSWEESESQQQRALKIRRVMRKKKFLLLLDDVWEGIDLQNIGIPLPQKENNCKVIFTGRSLDVCSDMDAHRKLKVEFLGEEDSWKLFGDKVGGREILELESIRPYAETIVRKCGGLPLALITIGKAMANKETEEEWKYAIDVLSRSPSELRGMEDVFTLLKFSYDNLETDTLRSCFLYCSLYPEDYSIDKEQLIEYWIGEGFLDSSHDSDVHNKGHAIIGSLKVACLLETGEEKTQVKMHDVIRSFALWIATECGFNKGLFLVEASMGLTAAPIAERWKEAQRISLMDNGITTLTELSECPNLLTLLLQFNSGLSRIPNAFFQFMPSLRVLDLSLTSIREIPASINKLVELQHFDLSGTKITELPEELGDLVKLKHLDLQRTSSLRTIPQKAVSGLLQLRVLNFYYSYSGWEDHNCEGVNEVGIADLECLKHLTTLGITVKELMTLKRLDNFGSLLKCIQYLYIKECKDLLYLQVSSNSSFGRSLRRLSINNCYDLHYLQVDKAAGDNWLPALEVLALHGLPSLAIVWKNPVTRKCLQNLRFVNIWHCHRLKNVSWVIQLPKLEVIYLMYCKEIEEIVSRDMIQMEDSEAFPNLKTLSIRDLPELKSITQWALVFPSLESIAVIDCPRLKKLPIKTHKNLTLPTVYGSKEWWDGLEWDECTIESAFLPKFMSI